MFAAASRASSETFGSSSCDSSSGPISTQQQDQHGADHEVHGRPRDRDQEFLHRLRRQPLQARDAADRQQRHHRRLDAEPARHEDVAEFVQGHAEKEQQDEDQAAERGGGAFPLPGAEAYPGQEQQERDMDLDVGPADATDRERPRHRGLPTPSAALRQPLYLRDAGGAKVRAVGSGDDRERARRKGKPCQGREGGPSQNRTSSRERPSLRRVLDHLGPRT